MASGTSMLMLVTQLRSMSMVSRKKIFLHSQVSNPDKGRYVEVEKRYKKRCFESGITYIPPNREGGYEESEREAHARWKRMEFMLFSIEHYKSSLMEAKHLEQLDIGFKLKFYREKKEAMRRQEIARKQLEQLNRKQKYEKEKWAKQQLRDAKAELKRQHAERLIEEYRFKKEALREKWNQEQKEAKQARIFELQEEIKALKQKVKYIP